MGGQKFGRVVGSLLGVQWTNFWLVGGLHCHPPSREKSCMVETNSRFVWMWGLSVTVSLTICFVFIDSTLLLCQNFQIACRIIRFVNLHPDLVALRKNLTWSYKPSCFNTNVMTSTWSSSGKWYCFIKLVTLLPIRLFSFWLYGNKIEFAELGFLLLSGI